VRLFPWQFPVKQKEFVAWSGNTGHSAGPHLHLEIRDTKTESPMNGLLFFNQIPETEKPILKQLALYNGTTSIYEQSPKLIPIMQQGIHFDLASPMLEVSSDKVFFGLQAADIMQVSRGILGVYEMRLYVNDKPHFA
jgi:hypothetical protein